MLIVMMLINGSVRRVFYLSQREKHHKKKYLSFFLFVGDLSLAVQNIQN